ncbi:MAG: 50S ribosomal protein L18 [Gemmatimonadetes bacterium]|nr:50S ribosomal protein L18 [Gemmatimonadota bacterium]
MSKSTGQQRRIGRRRRHRSIRRRLSGTSERPRLVVTRSLKNISAQIVDDTNGTTLLGLSSQSVDSKGTKVDRAQETGKKLAELAREKGVHRVVFDRAGYLYHGRVKALADGAREGGLEF